MIALDEKLAGRCASYAFAALEREYPNHLAHFLNDSTDVRPPRALHPAFYGCLDWHSAVHNHWLLVRLMHAFPGAPFGKRARALLAKHLTPDNIAKERDYFAAPGREIFERPYGWAWLLALDAELVPLPGLRAALAPLVGLIVERIDRPWMAAMPYPVRSGEHSNTAFALGLFFDWAGKMQRPDVSDSIRKAAEKFFFEDRAAPLRYEPSGHDFVSPVLAEADVVGRILAPDEFSTWLRDFLPEIPESDDVAWLAPAEMPDSEDYKLAHLPGLNLSRAWMLAGIAARLPPRDLRRSALQAAALAHAERGLSAALRPDYGASHWLPTFAVYCLTHPAFKAIDR